ncbi:hypothetical protein [Actinophytocola sp.]|uniref:hypothetical protein n=1 Tax=Actinophytocola sp. TaxID=1872138 RepID=UPI00389A4128
MSTANTTLSAPEYPGGELDRHAFTAAPGSAGTPPAPLNRTVFPTWDHNVGEIYPYQQPCHG